jgi:hypothetical protein
MPSNELERVASDLSSIRDAMRLGKPYTWDDVNRDLVGAFCGLLAMLLILFSPLGNKLAFTLGLLPGIVYYLRFSAQQHGRRAAHPSPWKEERLTLQALGIAVPLVVVWLLWSRIVGSIDIRSASAGALYFVGVGLGVLGVIDPHRRRYLAGSVVLLAYGLATPSLPPQQMVLGAAWALVAGSLLSAGITVFQLRFDSDMPGQGEATP